MPLRKRSGPKVGTAFVISLKDGLKPELQQSPTHSQRWSAPFRATVCPDLCNQLKTYGRRGRIYVLLGTLRVLE